MTREEWLRKYNADPKFRLNRLLMLERRNAKKKGWQTVGNPYAGEIERARAEIQKGKDQPHD